ncbi:hypothetical protein GYMLUDRAFT_74563 [Collybiopsis luxurians FD-317 M1]|uniref:Uncharacterized protein n=1 Tax=Collybiopsis luxurians FD-317 M1 TaxID=944289 RepID=A0A0D0B782_9AGAR|nr:hypothetical protein GYMLUDRAFT_74563 [Collybiopsis luxurians FD-317 M1]
MASLTPFRLYFTFFFWASLHVVVQASPFVKPIGSRNVTLLWHEQRREGIQIPVQLWIGHQNSEIEHWVLNLNNTYNLHTKQISHDPKKPLKPSTYLKNYFEAKDPNWASVDLGCEAMFESMGKLEDIVVEMVQIPWTKGAIAPGGNCMDFVKACLEFLEKGKFIFDVPPKFIEKYRKDYAAVTKKVWNVDVTVPS